jgi:glycosyltransferase involved in cell wall biosynthesis
VWVSELIFDFSLHKTTQLEILRNLEKRGNGTLLFAMRSRNQFRTQENPDHDSSFNPKLFLLPIRYVPIIASVIYTLVMAVLLPINILVSDPDFVIMEPGIAAISSIPSVVFSKLRKTKFVLDIRSVPVYVDGFRGVFNKLWFSVSVLIAKKLFSGITTITPMMKKEICTQFLIRSNRIGVWTSGVSVTLFNPDNWRVKGERLRSELGLSGKFVVFYHGLLVENRGIPEAVEAASISAKRHSDIALFFLGSGPFTSELKSIIKTRNLQNNVVFHDAVGYEEVPAYISMCDVCLIPLPDYSYWRPQSPLKLLEYLSMEKVVIATDLPAHRLVLDNQKCGIYISSVNPEIIAEGIEYALDSKDKLKDWGKSGREIILSCYTWEKVAEDLEKYLLSINQKTK